MGEKSGRKEKAKLRLDVDGIIYIGSAGCFCFAFIGFATYFFPQKPLAYLYGIPFALVYGIVALGLGIFLLVTSRQKEK